jgi:hypothetical protein
MKTINKRTTKKQLEKICTCKYCDDPGPKSVTEFYKANKTKTGMQRHSSYCSTCTKKYYRNVKKQSNKSFLLDGLLVKKCSCLTCNNPGPKQVKNFHITGKNKDGSLRYRSYCKDCIKKQKSKYYQENREYKLDWQKKWYNNNYISKRQYDKDYWINNKKQILEHKRNKYLNDIDYKCKILAHNMVWRVLNQNIITEKPSKTIDLLGYDGIDLKIHLESQFKNEYSWNTYGNGPDKWNIDHIIPVSSFNLANDDGTLNIKELRKCNALSNLRPLWEKDNFKKGNKLLDGSRIENKNIVEDIV